MVCSCAGELASTGLVSPQSPIISVIYTPIEQENARKAGFVDVRFGKSNVCGVLNTRGEKEAGAVGAIILRSTSDA